MKIYVVYDKQNKTLLGYTKKKKIAKEVKRQRNGIKILKSDVEDIRLYQDKELFRVTVKNSNIFVDGFITTEEEEDLLIDNIFRDMDDILRKIPNIYFDTIRFIRDNEEIADMVADIYGRLSCILQFDEDETEEVESLQIKVDKYKDKFVGFPDGLDISTILKSYGIVKE